MQTFLPYANFKQTAKCLDWRRLGKQRVECEQIANAILGIKTGWRNHPATKMWENNVGSLIEYGIVMCDEWVDRGYNDNTKVKLQALASDGNYSVDKPKWFGKDIFHDTHKSKLLGKDPSWYSQFNWGVEPLSVDKPYWWPTKEII